MSGVLSIQIIILAASATIGFIWRCNFKNLNSGRLQVTQQSRAIRTR